MNTPKPLHLRIEWNGELKAGQHLAPKFVMTGEDLRKLESVSCVLDPHLPQDSWESDPKNSIIKENQGWYFAESLSLHSADNSLLKGVFKIDFWAQFKIIQDSQLVTADYKTTFFLEVNDADAEVSVEADGDDNLIRVKTLPGDAKIRIRVHGNDNIVDIGPSLLYQSQAKNEQNLDNTCDVDLDPCFVGTILPSTNDPILYLHAKQSDGQERFFQIAARQRVMLGRAREKSNNGEIEASDFVYRFYRSDDTNPNPIARSLSNRISRNQLCMILSTHGLELKNLGKNINLKMKEEKDLPQNCTESINLRDLRETIDMTFARFSTISLKKFNALPQWNQGIENKLQKYNYLCNILLNPLWAVGASQEVNSLRFTRSLNCSIDELKKFVDSKYENSNWWTTSTMGNEEEYHLIVRMLTIGNDSLTDAIYFNREGMSNQHATLYFCDNHFGLINHSPTAIIYRQYGKESKLYEDECLPLQPGMDFRIGKVDFHIYESYSRFRDVQKQMLEETLEDKDNLTDPS